VPEPIKTASPQSRAAREADRQMRERDRAQTEQYRAGYESAKDEQRAASGNSGPGVLSRGSRTVTRGESQRIIVGTMAFGVVFALVSSELGRARAGKTGPAPTGKQPATPVTILVGGGVATILLLVISHAGDPGSELAEGLALVTALTIVLVNGKPVWDFANNLFGSTPTTPTGLQPSVGTGQYRTPAPGEPGYGTNPPISIPRRPGQPS
jgi:hypothetical protein